MLKVCFCCVFSLFIRIVKVSFMRRTHRWSHWVQSNARTLVSFQAIFRVKQQILQLTLLCIQPVAAIQPQVTHPLLWRSTSDEDVMLYEPEKLSNILLWCVWGCDLTIPRGNFQPFQHKMLLSCEHTHKQVHGLLICVCQYHHERDQSGMSISPQHAWMNVFVWGAYISLCCFFQR